MPKNVIYQRENRHEVALGLQATPSGRIQLVNYRDSNSVYDVLATLDPNATELVVSRSECSDAGLTVAVI